MRVFTAILVSILGLGATDCPAAAAGGKTLKPIIAQLLAEPATYAGKVITVYGLVVESKSFGKIFFLQDVSQQPLRVVGTKKLKAAVGDQLTVVGTFHAARKFPYVAARMLIPTRVLGGGGCC